MWTNLSRLKRYESREGGKRKDCLPHARPSLPIPHLSALARKILRASAKAEVGEVSEARCQVRALVLGLTGG